MIADTVRRTRSGIELPAIGAEFYAGFFAGVIDTTKGNIDAADAYQTGARFALIVSPKSLQASPLAWRSVTSNVNEARTRWDGLAVTEHVATRSGSWPAFDHCNGLSFPDDGASQWYLPAMDELELLFRNLKAVTENNNLNTESELFPPSAQANGVNPSSDPQGSAYTATDPDQTAVAAFQASGSQALEYAATSRFWSATEANGSEAWRQNFSQSGFVSDQRVNAKTSTSVAGVRPVRRVSL